MADWTESIERIVGKGGLEAPAASPWSGIPPPPVVSPGTAEEVAATLRFAAKEGLAVVPRGGGTKLSWGGPPRKADFILAIDRLNEVIAHEPGDMTVTAQPGVPFSDLRALVLSGDNRIDVSPPFSATATLGGVVASGSTGPIHVRLADLILGMQVALPDGNLVRTGGRVVKNVAGFDLHKAMVGSFGTLGVITEITLRLYPAPPVARCLSAEIAPGEVAGLLADLGRSEANPAWTLISNGPRDGAAAGGWIVHVGCEGEEAAVVAHLDRARAILGGRGGGSGSEAVGEAKAVRADLRDFPHDDPDCLPCRIGLLPSRVPDFLVAAGGTPILAHRESGLVRAAVPRAGTGESPGGVSHLRRLAEEAGGYLVAEAETSDDVDVWGPPRGDFFLLEGLKKAFDPEAVLSPGRYVGGL